MRFISNALVLIVLAGFSGNAEAKSFQDMFKSNRGFEGDALEFLQSLDYRQGRIELANGVVMDVPRNFYLLGESDARAVMEDAWGNPPDDNTMAMLFPIQVTPLSDNVWGIEVTFESTGLVSDDDADTADYDAVLKQMRADARDSNAWMKQNGYQTTSDIQWASEPFYDAQNKVVHWAQRIVWGDKSDSLNYNVRFLGRYGVLNLNYIADMKALPVIRNSVSKVVQVASFQEGYRYEDYTGGWFDSAAGIGIAGLVAGKAASKVGFFAVALVLLKKFWFLLLAPVAFFGKLFRRT